MAIDYSRPPTQRLPTPSPSPSRDTPQGNENDRYRNNPFHALIISNSNDTAPQRNEDDRYRNNPFHALIISNSKDDDHVLVQGPIYCGR
jgi:hypothetical protein